MVEFSVIIPAKNEERNISNCLQSIFNNNYPRENYEILLIDNGSTDATVTIAQFLGATVFQMPVGSISALRNFGAQKANGKILAFMDADCTVVNNWFQSAQKYIDKHDISCFGSPPDIPENATWVQKTWYKVREKKQEIVEVPWLESMNMFIQKDVFEKVDGFDEKLVTCEDVDISYRLSKHGKVVADTTIRAIHHGEASTLSEFFKKEKWRGQSNYKGLLQHGIKINELPSLVLPLFYGIFPMLCAILFLLKFGNCVFYLFIWQLPILIISFLKIKADFSLSLFMKLIILYNVYYLARFISVI